MLLVSMLHILGIDIQDQVFDYHVVGDFWNMTWFIVLRFSQYSALIFFPTIAVNTTLYWNVRSNP